MPDGGCIWTTEEEKKKMENERDAEEDELEDGLTTYGEGVNGGGNVAGSLQTFAVPTPKFRDVLQTFAVPTPKLWDVDTPVDPPKSQEPKEEKLVVKPSQHRLSTLDTEKSKPSSTLSTVTEKSPTEKPSNSNRVPNSNNDGFISVREFELMKNEWDIQRKKFEQQLSSQEEFFKQTLGKLDQVYYLLLSLSLSL